MFEVWLGLTIMFAVGLAVLGAVAASFALADKDEWYARRSLFLFALVPVQTLWPLELVVLVAWAAYELVMIANGRRRVRT